MTWLLWHQQRMQAASTAVVLGALALLLAITGVVMSHDYHSALATCSQPGIDCQATSLFSGDGAIIDLVNLTVAAPLLLGVFWGATSVGREYDTGTNVLAWTQSVTRRQWLRGKLVALFASSVVAGTALSVMVSWWSRTWNAYQGNHFDPLQFDIQGFMPIAYSVFAAALGLLAGAAWRRTLPAIATTVAGFVALRLIIEVYVRPYYLTPITSTIKGMPAGSWGLHTDLLHNGKVITGPISVPTACTPRHIHTRDQMNTCLEQFGFRFSSTYQPANRYWTFQWIETGIFVGIAALLVAAAVVLVLRRDA